MSEAPRTSRGWLQNALLVLGTVVVMLLVLEGAFRVLGIRGYHEARYRDWGDALVPEEELIPGIHLQLRPNSSFTFRYESNPRGYFGENNEMVFRTNRHGHRGPDFELEKPPGVRRIVVLGDSFTFGEGVHLEDTFAHRLATILNRGDGAPVEVLNLGVSAWSTVEEIEYLERVGLQFQPDLVMVVFVANDATYAAGLDFFDNFRERYERRALRHSYFVSWVYAEVGRAFLGRDYVAWLVDEALKRESKWDEVYDALSRGRELSAGVDAGFMVALFPFMYELHDDYPLLPIHQAVSRRCAEEQIPVLDLLDAFKVRVADRPYTDLWVHPTDQHPNEEAHGIAAEAMAEFVLSEELLQR